MVTKRKRPPELSSTEKLAWRQCRYLVKIQQHKIATEAVSLPDRIEAIIQRYTYPYRGRVYFTTNYYWGDIPVMKTMSEVRPFRMENTQLTTELKKSLYILARIRQLIATGA